MWCVWLQVPALWVDGIIFCSTYRTSDMMAPWSRSCRNTLQRLCRILPHLKEKRSKWRESLSECMPTRSTRNCDTHTWTLIRAYILYVKLQCWIESCSIYSLHNPNAVHVSCISNMNMYIRTLTCTTQVLVAIRIYVCVLSLFVVWYRSQRQFLRCRGTNSG